MQVRRSDSISRETDAGTRLDGDTGRRDLGVSCRGARLCVSEFVRGRNEERDWEAEDKAPVRGEGPTGVRLALGPASQ